MGSSLTGLYAMTFFTLLMRLSLCTFATEATCKPLVFSQSMGTVVAHMLMACGMASYTMLMNMGEVATWSAVVTLFVVVPVTLGILLLGESLTMPQYGGLAMCVFAALVLGGCSGK